MRYLLQLLAIIIIVNYIVHKYIIVYDTEPVLEYHICPCNTGDVWTTCPDRYA